MEELEDYEIEYIHNKTKNIYYKLNEAQNATNGFENQTMVIYANLAGKIFVREKTEFLSKFTIRIF